MWAYDTEVFKYNFIAVFINPETLLKVVITSKEQLKEFYKENANEVFIGYNSNHYDTFIIKSILLNMNPWKVSQHIIVEDRKGHEFSNAFKDINFYNYDIALINDGGLKKLEAYMGHDIQESTVSFDLDRPLTAKELEETIKYCTHDVEQTLEVLKRRPKDFISHIALIKAFNLNIKYISKSKAQLVAVILDAKKQYYNDEFDYQLPDTLVLNNPKYREIKEWYFKKENKDYSKSQKVKIYGVEHVLSFGGIHGAVENSIEEGILVNFDIASYYPALMIEYNLLSRSVTESHKYRKIRDERLILKREKNPKQEAYKIVLNSAFGASNDKYNPLYDSRQANSVCISGQLLLVDLLEKIEDELGDSYMLMQSNTDGVLGKCKDEYSCTKLIEICARWSKRTRMELEFETYQKIVQKDVNNYIILDSKGKIKSKGAYTKELNSLDNNLPIVNKAIMNYFMYNISVEETINNCDKLIDFQLVIKIGRTYECTYHGEKRLNEKCLRVFASRNQNDGGIFKLKETSKQKVANTPIHAFIDNGNIINKTVPYKLDRKWYIELAYERIRQFTGEKKNGKSRKM